jgi:phage baseplate assembly protein W
MGTYSFKSVGRTTQDRNEEAASEIKQIPIGIITPIRLGAAEGLLGMHFNLEDQAADNLKNLIMTNWGERLGLYRYGANLQPLLSDYTTQNDFDSLAIQRISSAVSLWMPYITLEDFISSNDRKENKNTAIMNLLISYTIPSIESKKRAIEVKLYLL